MNLPDHMILKCPLCGAEDDAPITYDWSIEGHTIELAVNVAEDASVAKHVLDRHLKAPDAAPPGGGGGSGGGDGELGPVVTDDGARTHVVSRPVPFVGDVEGRGGDVQNPQVARAGAILTLHSGESPQPSTSTLSTSSPDTASSSTVHERLDILLGE